MAATQEAGDPETAEDIGEIEIAEYLMLLLAVDTFAGHVEETTGAAANDDQTHSGIRLLRLADRQNGDALRDHLVGKLTRDESQRAVIRSFNIKVNNAEQAGRRALTLKTALNRGGAATLKAVFEEARPRNAVKTSIAASMLDDAAAALDRYGALPIRNVRIKAWIKGAREIVGTGASIHNPVESAAAAALDHVQKLKGQKVAEEGTTGAQDVHDLQDERAGTIDQLQTEATEAARAAIEISGEEDMPPTRSEVIGLATAVAAAAVADSTSPANVPESLRRLDAEQQAAALTDGRVLVAAGAGSGKSTTLVARVKYLVDERQVNPSRILVSSFNKKAADDLETKIGKVVGGERAKQMEVGTLHGLFKGAISKYGTQEEQAMFRGKQSILNGSAIGSAVNRLWRKCHAEEVDGVMRDAETPNAKEMMMAKTKWSGNGITPAMAKENARSDQDQKKALWYEMYEGLKGAIPGWKPACEGKAEATREYDNFLKKNRLVRGKNDQEYLARIGDFDDMVTVFKSILERSPDVRRRAQKAFDHVLIDECQDLNSTQNSVLEMMTEHITDGADGKSFWMVGDDKQCPSAETPIDTPRGPVLARDLQTGDEVLSWRNGVIKPQRATVSASDWTWGYQVTTDSGRKLTISPNHKIWATPPVLEPHQVAVYLMHRSDMGFRVGITNKGQRGAAYLGSLAGRAFQEKAEKMWILSIHEDREQAKFAETSISLRFGIPTSVFNGVHRGLNQARIEQTFEAFGRNGGQVLELRHLSLDLPHWISKGYVKHGRERRVVQLIAHMPKWSLVRLEWSRSDSGENPFGAVLTDVSYEETGRDRYRLRKAFADYREAQEFAVNLARVTGSLINHCLATPEGVLQKFTAAGLFSGMRIPVRWNDTLSLEVIHSVERVETTFVNLEVDDASNFFGNGILSHNSIYGFRGSRPDIFTGRAEKPDWKVRMMRTNYRCPPEVVGAANKLIAHNEDQIPMEANAAPGRAAGEASITANVYADEAATAIAVASEIKKTWDDKTGEISDNAILARTNKELNSYETALLMRGIPYARKGASSFLSSPETKAFLGYVTLVTDADAEKTQQALRDILNKPNRFFVGPEQVERAVDLALNGYGRKTGIAKKAVDPMVALRDNDFQSDLVFVLTGARTGFKANKAYGHLEALINALDGLSVLTQSEEASTKDMFDEVLQMPGTKFKVNAITGRIEGEQTVSFRDELSASIKDYGDEDEEVQDEERPDEMNLGNISFLYELAKPNPEDPGDLEISPETPRGFWAKMGRLNERAKELRIDVSAWEKGQAKYPPDERKPPPGVFLATVHATKGAEWSNVYLQMAKGKFPIEPRKKDEDEDSNSPERLAELATELEGERRLAYVALTRPIKNLRIVAPGQIQGKPAGMSRFLAEAGLVLGENVATPGLPKTAANFAEDVFGFAGGF